MVHALRLDRSSRRWLQYALLSSSIILLLFACVPTLVRIERVRQINAPEDTLNDYTFVGDDYLPYYPLDLDDVAYTPEGTVHYQIFSEDAEREWQSITPGGGEFPHLGPDGRTFGIAIFHQLHCLVKISRAIRTKKSSGHAHHCINYLRQAILCEADATLEPVLPSASDGSLRVESPRVCKDWTRVYQLAKGTNRRRGEDTERVRDKDM